MKERGLIDSVALTSEKLGYIGGTFTITAILLGFAVSPSVAINLLAGSATFVIGGKLAQKNA